jgi:glutathione S-transferase
MVKLCGFAISNYYNKVKLALLEKGIAFEEEASPPSQDERFLARSPMGKVPYLEVDGKCLAESQAIMEYLEEAYPANPLYPKDPWEKAKVRELVQILEWYLDGPGRPLIGPAFFGAPLSEEMKTRSWSEWERGVKGLNRICKFDPFIAGNTLTVADCAAYAHLQLAATLSNMIHGKNVVDGVRGANAYLEMMKSRATCQKVSAGQAKAMEAFMASKKSG